MNANDIHLDDQLSSLLPVPTDAELSLLREALRAEGMRTPVEVWPTGGRRVLLDGYCRIRLARELGVEIRCTEVRLADRNAAIAYRLDRHLSRRNLSQLAQAVLRGRLHLLVGGRQGERTDLPGHDAGAMLTARGIAARYAVSERTIRRDKRLAEAVDLLGLPEHLGPAFTAQLLASRSNLTRRGVLQLARLKKVEQEQYLARLEQERAARRSRPRRKPPATKVPGSTGNSSADTLATREELVPAVGRNLPDARQPVTRGWLPVAARSAGDSAVVFCVAKPDTTGIVSEPEPVDEAVLTRLSDLWEEANHPTRRAFLHRPAVQIAIQRLNSSEARK